MADPSNFWSVTRTATDSREVPAKMTFGLADTFSSKEYDAGPNGEGSPIPVRLQELRKTNARTRIPLKAMYVFCLHRFCP